MSVNTNSEMDHNEEESGCGAGSEPHGKQDDEVRVFDSVTLFRV